MTVAKKRSGRPPKKLDPWDEFYAYYQDQCTKCRTYHEAYSKTEDFWVKKYKNRWFKSYDSFRSSVSAKMRRARKR